MLGSRELGAGELFVLSNYTARSFDSRYFGGVDAEAVRARIVPVFTWGEPWRHALHAGF
jgi:type IV secretory pathway protease TraF